MSDLASSAYQIPQVDLSVPRDVDLKALALEKVEAIISGAFDPGYYRRRYGDIKYNSVSPIEHYCRTGWREGRDPSDWFSTTQYLNANADVSAADINPLLHYILYGRSEGRTIFSPEERPLGDVALSPTIEFPLDPDSGFRAAEMASLHEYFDHQFYLDHYPDMRAPGLDLLEHYCVFGWKEGRDPCSWFSTRHYLQHNRDVDNKEINPFYHYITDGRAEGRPIRPAGYSGPRELALDTCVSLVSDKALHDLLRFEPRVSATKRGAYDPAHLRIDWVVPDFAVGSGGHMTIFRIVRCLELFGHLCRIWISDLTLHSRLSYVYDDIVKHFQTLRAEVLLADDGLADATGDVVFATGWQTVARVMNTVGFRERFYFVQDLEPSFYPAGSHYLAAEWTYTQPLACICASQWLASTLSNRFGRWARDFTLAYDPEFYYQETCRDNFPEIPELAVYGRTTSPRRCVEMVFLALEHLASSGVRFVVNLYGADIEDRSASFPCVVHGILEAGSLGDLYRRSSIGICFSATNYSLIPQEMMACGLPVVEIDGPSTQAIFPDGVVTRSGPHPLQISAEIGALLLDPRRRQKQAMAALQWIQDLSWEKSARTIETAILGRLREVNPPVRATRSVRTKPADRARPHASVCVPTFNGGDLLAKVIDKVKAQRCPWDFEIVIVDSSSTDGSIDKLFGASVTIEKIAQTEFQHGRTRNRCIEIARGQFVAFLTQDALPRDEFWLYNLVATLDHFPNAAGAFGRHVAWPSASPFVKRDIEGHFEQFMLHPLSMSRETDPSRWDNHDNSWRQILHFYSDNNSCMRRSVWENHPYPEIEYGEDHVWANSIIEAGFERVYAPAAVVYHSHDYTLDEIEKRAATESSFFQRHFGYLCYDFTEPFDEQLQRRNGSDERWARAHKIDEQTLQQRLSENEAQLRGMRVGML